MPTQQQYIITNTNNIAKAQKAIGRQKSGVISLFFFPKACFIQALSKFQNNCVQKAKLI